MVEKNEQLSDPIRTWRILWLKF